MNIKENDQIPNSEIFVMDEKENYDIIENNIDKVKFHIKQRI